METPGARNLHQRDEQYEIHEHSPTVQFHDEYGTGIVLVRVSFMHEYRPGTNIVLLVLVRTQSRTNTVLLS